MIAAAAHPVLAGPPYAAYVYAYPHKTAYRPLAPRPLRDVWADEPRDRLFLYVHVPFCAMRCGFCNLFTTANPPANLVPLYLDALRRQADAVRAALPDARFARFAIGGGTPTYLSESELDAVFALAEDMTGGAAIPISVEASPDTLTAGKADVLAARGVSRVSLGVQSFEKAETGPAGRPQNRTEVETALTLLVGRFPTVNVDLIYGLPGQTVRSWLDSVRAAVAFGVTELYLYPLYVRPLTGLGKSAKIWDDLRLSCYREARDLLASEGFQQVSMRLFRRGDSPEAAGPAYCCQEDGMVGLGSGARSYTRGLHYSFEYAVAARGVRDIIADYLARDEAQLAAADFGYELDADDQRRRYLLQSLLTADGLDVARYRSRFGSDPANDFPDLPTFADLGLLTTDGATWRPTALGLERSDALGPWFFSPRVRRLMTEYEPR